MSKQFVIQSRTAGQDGNRVPLGTRSEIVESLARFNTLAEVEGGDMLWGPGIRIELPTEDVIQQMLLYIVEEEIECHGYYGGNRLTEGKTVIGPSMDTLE